MFQKASPLVFLPLLESLRGGAAGPPGRLSGALGGPLGALGAPLAALLGSVSANRMPTATAAHDTMVPAAAHLTHYCRKTNI